MATANELIDPLLNKRQKANQANQLPQTGLSPAQGVANVAAGIGDGLQAGAESVQRGLAQQGRAIKTVAGGAGGAIAAGADYLNRGDPVRDAAAGIASGIGKVGDFFADSAAKARTSDYGQMMPGDRSPAAPANGIDVLPPTAQSNSTPTAPIVPAAVAAPMQPQTAPAAAAPTASTAVMSTSQTMPAGIGDLAPGTGMIRNGRTGKVTAIDSGAPQEPVMQITRTTPAALSPAAQAANEQLALSNNLMARPDGGIGEALVARGALNKAKTLSGMATDQQQADTAAQNSGIAGFNALSQDADRRVGNEISRDALDEKKRGNALRDELMALDDKSDPGGTKRASLKQKLQLLSGKEQDHYQPIMGRDDLGNPVVVGIFNKQTGKMVDPSGNPVRSQQEIAVAHNDAQAAIAKGMDKNEANRRLLAAGLPAIQ